MATLYELSADLLTLFNSDDEITEEQLEAASCQMLQKVGDYCKLFRGMESDAETIGNEIDRLKHRKQILENNLTRAKDRLKFCMEMTALDEIKTPDKLFTVKIQQNPPRVVVNDDSILPARFITVIQETRIDKTAIRDALKNGEEIPGAELQRGTSLRIR